MDRIDYEVWLKNALSSGDDELVIEEYALLNTFVTRFNQEIGKTISKYGQERTDAAIWTIYGHGGDIREAVEPSVGNKRIEFMESIKQLYVEGFNRYCSCHFGHLDSGPEPPQPLNSSCYMLWDLDGIECAAINGDPEMSKASLDVLEFALKLPNPACQESALHGLGHLVCEHADRVQPLIHNYLSKSTVPNELKRYAKLALTGNIL